MQAISPVLEPLLDRCAKEAFAILHFLLCRVEIAGDDTSSREADVHSSTGIGNELMND